MRFVDVHAAPSSICTDENVEAVRYASMTIDGVIRNSKTINQYTTLYYSNLKTYTFRCTRQQCDPPCTRLEKTGKTTRAEHFLKATFGVGIFSLWYFHIGK